MPKPLDSKVHFEYLRKLVALEERDEILRFRDEFLRRSPEERERAGKALLRLNVSEFHFNAAGHRLITLRYVERKPLPIYSLDIGDPVSLSEDLFPLAELPIGTVYEKSADSITVAFGRDLPSWVHEEGIYYLNLAGNRMTYKKMVEALGDVATAEHSRLSYFRDVSLGLRPLATYDPVAIDRIPFLNDRLNPWQKEAAAKALASKDLFLIHGPPGTGKTTVLIEIIRQTIRDGKFVFVTAPSNTACDHLLECLVTAGVAAVRLGHPARIMEHLREHTLDFKLASHALSQAADELEFQLLRCYTKKDRHRERRALDREEKHELHEEIGRLKAEIRRLEDIIYSDVVERAPVMVGTHAGARESLFRKKKFDLLVMDEASQSTEPSSWIPMLRAEKVVMAGDHLQLPPTVISKEAEEKGLTKTLFERLHGLVGEDWKSLLKIQYRMHEKIMNFSSRQFYDGALVAHESVRSHALADLEGVKREPETEEVFLFLDTAGRGFEEALEPGSESRYNRDEAELVAKHLKTLLALGVRPEAIAVISPYSAQVRLLNSLIAVSGIEMDSVDGFQGREKEVVILSLVRSNVEGELGFLTDTRRMNVAMTRARRKLLVIGDSATLATIPFYRDFVQYAESIGAYRSSWEEIEP